MSLTSLLKEADVRERFYEEFTKPSVAAGRQLLAAPLSKRYSLVGIAFDYLLRFHLQRFNPRAVHRSWVAELGLRQLVFASSTCTSFNIDTAKFNASSRNPNTTAGHAILKRAKAAHSRYLAS